MPCSLRRTVPWNAPWKKVEGHDHADVPEYRVACEICNPVCAYLHKGDYDRRLRNCGTPGCPVQY